MSRKFAAPALFTVLLVPSSDGLRVAPPTLRVRAMNFQVQSLAICFDYSFKIDSACPSMYLPVVLRDRAQIRKKVDL